jgi:hypothetical protein
VDDGRDIPVFIRRLRREKTVIDTILLIAEAFFWSAVALFVGLLLISSRADKE